MYTHIYIYTHTHLFIQIYKFILTNLVPRAFPFWWRHQKGKALGTRLHINMKILIVRILKEKRVDFFIFVVFGTFE